MLSSLKIGGRKYYLLEEIEHMRRTDPVASRPHHSRRPVPQPAPKLTLWQKIKALFA
jgi:hypothetical protein